MLVFSSGGTESKGSKTFTNMLEAWKFINKKKFYGFKTRTVSNKTYGTEIVFYSM